MDITERFLNYTKFDTQSAEDSQTVPSTSKQLIFAEYLKKELEHEGLDDVEMDDKGYIYATLKANTKEHVPTIGFISHYDTSPDCSGADIKPQIVKNYDGSDILLRGEKLEVRGERNDNIIMSPKKFPELLQHVGEDLIVTDGTTLLGADDKAGCRRQSWHCRNRAGYGISTGAQGHQARQDSYCFQPRRGDRHGCPPLRRREVRMRMGLYDGWRRRGRIGVREL